MPLPDAVRARMAAVNAVANKTGPLWQGPEDSGPLGGVTFSLMSKFLTCRERFRVHYVEGLRPNPAFNHKIEYGQMWHECEAELARGQPSLVGGWNGNLEAKLKEYAVGLRKKYPLSQEQINHWYQVCRAQFPLYVTHWMQHSDVVNRKPLEQEKVFSVRYVLPSGRTVTLKGKRDSVDLILDDQPGIWVAENKTKGDVDEVKMRRQLTFDLQTMTYLTAAHWQNDHDALGNPLPYPECTFGGPIAGVRYNVVRRPLSGGKGSIVQGKGTPGGPCSACKGTGRTPAGTKVCSKCDGSRNVPGKPAESDEAFYTRMAQYVKDEPSLFFMRWKVAVTRAEIEKFRRTCLDPILENLCDWYDEVTGKEHRSKSLRHSAVTGKALADYRTPMNWRHPFGVYNSLDEGGSTDLDQYLENGSEVGLSRVNTLFEELK